MSKTKPIQKPKQVIKLLYTIPKKNMETRNKNKKLQEQIQTLYKIRSSINKSINLTQIKNCKTYYSLFVKMYGVRSKRLEKNIIDKTRYLIFQYELN